MPLFSEHISNMYYSGSPSYSNPYSSYSSSISPLGTSYSASYLNPGGSYSSHSSLGGYSRAPITSRWIPGLGRNYSPMLTPISERGISSPVRINSPRRIPITKRSYGTSGYTQRPKNINTADIDVSTNKYRRKSIEVPAPKPSPQKEPSKDDKEKNPFMPRVDGKPETGIDSSPGLQRNTIKRGRTVVRLHTVKRKERDSPRKPTEILGPQDDKQNAENIVEIPGNDIETESNESKSWREKLSEDLNYTEKKEKKSLGTKFVETFIVKDLSDREKIIVKNNLRIEKESQSLPVTPQPTSELPTSSKLADRRCSIELLAEQASVLDSLIRSENLSTATLDISKVGIAEETKANNESIKWKKSGNRANPLKTTKSDQSLHDNLKSLKNTNDSKSFSKRRSLKKSSSGGSICRLDSITEFPKDPVQSDLLPVEENRTSIKLDKTNEKLKPKLKAKITGSVEISLPSSPLKFRIENVTVEEKVNVPRKEITFSSVVEDASAQDITVKSPVKRNERRSIKKKNKNNSDPISPEPEDGNFWDKIGKRETVYLMKRKQNLDEMKEKHKRALFWFPEDGDAEFTDTTDNNEIPKRDISNESNANQQQDKTSDNMEINTQHCDISQTEKNNIANIINSEKLFSTYEDIQCKPKTEEKQESQNELENCIFTKSNLIEASINLKRLSKGEKDQEETSSETILDSKENLATLHNSKSKPDLKNKQNESKPESKTSDSITKIPVPNDVEGFSVNNIIGTLLKSGENINETILSELVKKTEGQPLIGEKLTSLINIDTKLDKIDSRNSSKREKEVYDSVKGSTIKTSESDKVEYIAEKNLQDLPLKLKENTQGGIITQNIVDSKEKSLLEEKLTPLPNNERKANASNGKIEPKIKTKVNDSEILQSHARKVSENSNDIQSYVKQKDLKEITIIEKTKDNILEIKRESRVKQQEKSPSLKNTETETDKTTSAKHQVKHSEGTKDTNYEQDATASKCKNDDKKVTELETKSKMTKVKSTSSVPKKIKSAKKAEPKSLSNNTDMKTEAASSAPKLKETKTVQKCPIHSVDKTDSNASNNAANDQPMNVALQAASTEPAKINNNTSKSVDSLLQTELQSTLLAVNSHKSNEASSNAVLQIPMVVKSENIPKTEVDPINLNVEIEVQTEKKTEDTKADIKIDDQTNQLKKLSLKADEPPLMPSPKKPVKEEKAVKPLIATPRPLQKRPPQIINSSESSDSSSDDESSDEEEESENSEGSNEFFECENNTDGRTSTGSNDSGFDSSAPTSPASFMQIKKDCDVNCHRKCEKLTANLCGVNQRLLVEALATRTASKKGADSPGPSSSNAASQLPVTDILEQELEQSTAYGIFRKTGRFTPPARSIPRFRKYMVEDFQFIKVLGKGSFGKVLLAELRDTEYYYAVKCLKKDVVLEDDDVECTLIERKVLALGTNHPYLCHLFATFQTDSHLFFVMEYLNGGDLMFHIQQSGRFPEARARFYGAEIVSGLKFLHKRGIVYRDLKLDNILLDFDGHVRIADFGMCKLQIYLDKTADTFCGTPDYMAPEIIKGLKYNQTVDWWSFGVLLYEMLIGQSPFSGCDEDELFWSICNEMPSYPRFLSQEALTILTRLLDKDARTRLGGVECMHGEIREQDFFHQIHWDRLERRELEAPFRPRVRHPLDTQYFDRAFTGERPRLTAVEPHVLRSMDQEPFRGFSYTNPNATDR